MDFSLILLLVLGLFFILFGIFVLFLPEVREKGQKGKPVLEKKKSKKRILFFDSRKPAIVSTLIILFGLILTILVGTSTPNSSSSPTGSSGTTSTTSEPTSSEDASSTTPSSDPTSISSTVQAYTLSFQTNGGSTLDPITLEVGEAITLPEDPTKEGHTFDGWFTDESLATAFSLTTMPNNDVTLYAKWLVNQYTLTFNTRGGPVIDALTIDFGTTVEQPLDPGVDFGDFVGWFYDTRALEPVSFPFTMPAMDVTVYADWNFYDRKINASDGVAAQYFGKVVALSDEYIVVGVSDDDELGNNAGAAYVYRINDPLYERKLTAFDGEANDFYGYAVAIQGKYLVVSAPGFDTASNVNVGAVYVYDLTDDTFVRVITPSIENSNGIFGNSLSISGDYLAVGAYQANGVAIRAGAVFVYRFSDETFESVFTASDGASDDFFGHSIELDGNYLVVGSYFDDDSGNDSGSVYLFKLDDPTYERKILASDGAASFKFGYAVQMREDRIVVGAPNHNLVGAGSGKVYFYSITDDTLEETLVPSDHAAGDYFGESLALDGDVLMVGASYNDTPINNAGTAYIYHLGDIIQEDILFVSDGGMQDQFGYALDIYGKYCVVSAPWDDDKGNLSGSVFFYSTTRPILA